MKRLYKNLSYLLVISYYSTEF